MSDAADTPDGEQTPDRDEIPPTRRNKALSRDEHTCQLCGTKGPDAGGIIPVEVHHKTYNPTECRVHDLPNLITLCRHCHNWHHNRPSDETPAVDISDEAKAKLIETDIEIIHLLTQNGPLTIAEIADRVSPDQTQQAVKERLYRIMGIDTEIDTQETQLIDQDEETGQWGLPHQIDISQRRVPDEVQEIVQRTVDKIVELAIKRGCDRETVAKIVDINARTAYLYKYRAQAYDFPIGLYTGQGRPRKNSEEITHKSAEESTGDGESQQSLDNLSVEEPTGEDADGEPATTDDVDTDETDPEETSPVTDSASDNNDPPEEFEVIDPMQPQPDGSNREYLITAADYPEELHPIIHRLNLAKISKREHGQSSEDPQTNGLVESLFQNIQDLEFE